MLVRSGSVPVRAFVSPQMSTFLSLSTQHIPQRSLTHSLTHSHTHIECVTVVVQSRIDRTDQRQGVCVEVVSCQFIALLQTTTTTTTTMLEPREIGQHLSPLIKSCPSLSISSTRSFSPYPSPSEFAQLSLMRKCFIH